jgi:DNA-binding transcriptional LysR family regulator
MEENGCCYRVKLESVLEFGSIEAIKKCVTSGLGISILPRIAMEQELTSGLLKELHWNCLHYNIHTQMIYRKDKWISPALAAFVQLAEVIQSES